MIDRVSKQDCVGCKACGDICPVNAITYEIDQEGFWFPKIRDDLCVKCGLCEKACPALERHYASQDNYKEPKVYKVYHKDKNIRYNSTSGALYYGLADVFLKDGGYIVGCVFDEDWKGAHHYISNSYDGLKKIMRTKYFQSDTEGIYRQVKKLLDDGENVLFCGAPCQVSALYGFVGKEYPNLYSADFICLGVNTPLAIRRFIEELEKKYKSKVAEVHFKNKSYSWTDLSTLVTFQNGKKYFAGIYNDAWLNGQQSGLYKRCSCYNCRYKGFPRIADITMGDFWGLDFTAEEEKYGLSVAIVNSVKGEQMFRNASTSLVVEERSVQEVIKGNPMLKGVVKVSPKREEFFRRVNHEPFSKIIWDIRGISWPRRTTRVILNRTKRWLKRLIES